MTNLTRTTTPNAAPLLNLDLPSRCDQCGKPRSSGSHRRCSSRRQALNLHKWVGRP